jgi:hypothetical protein
MPGQKREARLRARCPGHPRLCCNGKEDVDGRDEPAMTAEGTWLQGNSAVCAQLILLAGGPLALTHCELLKAIVPRTIGGTIMADRSALQFVGFVFATVTLAVMLTAGMVVKGYADGVYTLDGGRAVIDR